MPPHGSTLGCGRAWVVLPDPRLIEPIIDRVIPFDEAPEAYRLQFSGAQFGKVVIETVAAT
jgi:NADPH:quinone reductase-like Zn-dependent oxidoreductase